MDTRAVAREVRLREWSEVMRQRVASGLSINAWCATNGVGRHQYFYWQRKLREAACNELAARTPETETRLVPTGWARIEPQVPAPAESGVTIEVGGCRVTVTGGTDLELLAQVCRVLKSL